MSTRDIITTSIRVRLAVLNKNQTWLADKLEKSRAWVSDRMNNRVAFDFDVLDEIAQALGVQTSALTSGDLIPQTEAPDTTAEKVPA